MFNQMFQNLKNSGLAAVRSIRSLIHMTELEWKIRTTISVKKGNRSKRAGITMDWMHLPGMKLDWLFPEAGFVLTPFIWVF